MAEESYERETGLWNEVFSECTPVDLRTLNLAVEPLFDEALRQFADRTERILDFGCGTGDISFQYIQYRPDRDVYGVDRSETGIRFARECARLSDYRNMKFEVGGDEWLEEYNGKTFDGIILSNVLDVMPLDVAKTTIYDLKRLLSPGGTWFIKLNPYYTGEELMEMGYEKSPEMPDTYEKEHVMRLRQETTDYWKKKLSILGDELIYLEFEYPWQEGLNRLFVMQDEREPNA